MADREVIRSASRGVQLDEVAHLVHGALESLLAEESPTLSSAPPAATASGAPAAPTAPALPLLQATQPPRTIDAPRSTPSNTPTTLERQPAIWGFDLGALLGLHGVAESAPVVLGGTATTHVARRRGTLHFGGWLTAEYRPPFDVGRDDLPPTAQTVALRALTSVDFYHRRPWSLGLAIGGGFDIFTIERGFKEIGKPPTRYHSTHASPVLAALSIVRFRLTQNVHLTLLGGVELDIDYAELDASHQSRQTRTLWPVRPALQVGLTFTALGAESFD